MKLVRKSFMKDLTEPLMDQRLSRPTTYGSIKHTKEEQEIGSTPIPTILRSADEETTENASRCKPFHMMLETVKYLTIGGNTLFNVWHRIRKKKRS